MSEKMLFDEQTPSMLLKAEIVTQYFTSWAQIASKRQGFGKKIAYLDLCAGSGKYQDGGHARPLLILERAEENLYVRQSLVTLFNEFERRKARILEAEIAQLSRRLRLRYQPVISAYKASGDLLPLLEEVRAVPTLYVLDPWGYRGLSLALLEQALSESGSACIFFFNYNRIARSMNFELVEESLKLLFGEERAQDLRTSLESLERPGVRRQKIVEEISQASGRVGERFVLPFACKSERGSRIVQHVVLVSKDEQNYEIMKTLMAKMSTRKEEDIATFTYSPVEERKEYRQQSLFPESETLEDLKREILFRFAGQARTCKQVFRAHNVGTPFVEKNYRQAMSELEAEGKISPIEHTDKRLSGKQLLGSDILFAFPAR